MKTLSFFSLVSEAWETTPISKKKALGVKRPFSRRYAERIWGEFFILARRTVGKLPVNFSANFDGEF